MAKRISKEERLQQIENLKSKYTSISEFNFNHPYLYRWALNNGVDLKKLYPRQPKPSKFIERENKGIDCYKVGSKKLYKHYPFVIEALRDLDLTYYYVKKVLKGELPSVNGYTFVACE